MIECCIRFGSYPGGLAYYFSQASSDILYSLDTQSYDSSGRMLNNLLEGLSAIVNAGLFIACLIKMIRLPHKATQIVLLSS